MEIANITQVLQKQPVQPNSESLSLMQKPQTNSLSIWRNEPPADPEYIKTWMATLGAAFPQCRPEFWAIVGKMVRKDGLSQKRLAHIADTLCREWKYPTMQIADILQIDKQVKIWHYSEFVKEFRTTAVSGYCILKERASDGRIQFAVTSDAEAAGIEIQQKFE